MALIACPDCGTEMSDKAPACPKCGRPNAAAGSGVHGKQEGCFLRTMNVGCAVIIGFIVLVFVIGMIVNSTKTP